MRPFGSRYYLPILTTFLVAYKETSMFKIQFTNRANGSHAYLWRQRLTGPATADVYETREKAEVVMRAWVDTPSRTLTWAGRVVDAVGVPA